jgi:arylformamidase
MARPTPTGTRVIDLTHTISPDMPFYPGTEPPVFSRPCTLESHGFVEQKITLYSHTGTHMDAPAHILKGAPELDGMNINHFVGKAVVLDLRNLNKPSIGFEDMMARADAIRGHDFVILYTGWGRFWGTDAYYKGFPSLTLDGAAWLARYGLKGIGMDMISIDPPDSTDFPVHRLFMERNTVIIENLANLDKVVGKSFQFCCLPLKIREADGAPVRAVAIIED